MRPREVLHETAHLLRRRKDTRHYWGPGPGDREPILRALLRELKSRRLSATFAQDWDNYDLFLSGNLAAGGRLYSAPEHYDQVFSAHGTIMILFGAMLIDAAL